MAVEDLFSDFLTVRAENLIENIEKINSQRNDLASQCKTDISNQFSVAEIKLQGIFTHILQILSKKREEIIGEYHIDQASISDELKEKLFSTEWKEKLSVSSSRSEFNGNLAEFTHILEKFNECENMVLVEKNKGTSENHTIKLSQSLHVLVTKFEKFAQDSLMPDLESLVLDTGKLIWFDTLIKDCDTFAMEISHQNQILNLNYPSFSSEWKDIAIKLESLPHTPTHFRLSDCDNVMMEFNDSSMRSLLAIMKNNESYPTDNITQFNFDTDQTSAIEIHSLPAALKHPPSSKVFELIFSFDEDYKNAIELHKRSRNHTSTTFFGDRNKEKFWKRWPLPFSQNIDDLSIIYSSHALLGSGELSWMTDAMRFCPQAKHLTCAFKLSINFQEQFFKNFLEQLRAMKNLTTLALSIGWHDDGLLTKTAVPEVITKMEKEFAGFPVDFRDQLALFKIKVEITGFDGDSKAHYSEDYSFMIKSYLEKHYPNATFNTTYQA
jgi:hypothetical protein